MMQTQTLIQSHIPSLFDYTQNPTGTLQIKKRDFLNTLLSKSSKKNKYKRYMGSLLRYAGGKSLAVGHIVELIPENISKIVSSFFGGGSLEIALCKELGLEVIGYDIFGILVNFWQVVLENPQGLFNKLKLFRPTKDEYYKNKEILKAYWLGKMQLQPVELAALYYFNHNLSYGPGFLGWPSSVYLNEKRYEVMINKIKGFEVDNLNVEVGDFENTIKQHPKNFLYLDPPYFLDGDSKMFRGIYPQRNFPIHHKGFKHKKLFELLKNHKGGFILSYNDCKQIRSWYSDFEIFMPSWQYTMGQGETRIGLNRIRNGANHIKSSHELLIVGRGR